jgi:hypothetical protein
MLLAIDVWEHRVVGVMVAKGIGGDEPPALPRPPRVLIRKIPYGLTWLYTVATRLRWRDNAWTSVRNCQYESFSCGRP